MNRELENAVKDWLRAEAAGRGEDAENRLGSVFRARSAETPSKDFVGRTMALLAGRAPELAAPERVTLPVSPFLDWAFKIGVAASLLLAGVSAVLFSGMVAAFARSGGSEHAVGWGIGLLAAASEQVARSLMLWGGLNRVAGILASAVIGPQSLGAVALGLVVSLMAFRGLTQLVVFERSANHV